MKILVINGPNLNLLLKRNKNLYGTFDLKQINKLVQKEFPSHTFNFVQSNVEGEIVIMIQNAESEYDGIIINPGGYAHTSVAIKDALDISKLPKIEVHLSNIAGREDFRQRLITATSCDGCIFGFKEKGYLAAIYILEKISSAK